MSAVTVYGQPAPKGSLKCIGRGGHHQLVEDNARTKPWRELVKTAGLELAKHNGHRLEGALALMVTFTLERPASVTPAKRTWPHKRSKGSGDVDKLARTLLDGLEDANVFHDDAQVCSLLTVKCYPDSGIPDGLDRPGAVIRLYPMEAT